MNFLQSDKAIKLFIVLAGFFITNAVLAEFIGVKIFSLEQSLGIQAVSFSFFGFGPLSFNLTAGVLLWPIVFTLTDILNEYFGIKGVRFLSYLAVTLICFSFLVVFAAIRLVPADFWPMSHFDQSIPIDKIEVGTIIQVKAGEMIPLDGIIISGEKKQATKNYGFAPEFLP